MQQPGPLRIEQGYKSIYIWDSTGNCYVEIPDEKGVNNHAAALERAHFIVRCVNSHTALVEALEACLILEYTKEIAPHLPGNLMPMIKAALRQATGGA